jgi:hypothetical protein
LQLAESVRTPAAISEQVATFKGRRIAELGILAWHRQSYPGAQEIYMPFRPAQKFHWSKSRHQNSL